MNTPSHHPQRATPTLPEPTMPTVPTVLCGVDPGVKYCGYAILSETEQLHRYGTWIPQRHLSLIDRHLWLVSRLMDLIHEWQPTHVAYEDFIWKRSEQGAAPVLGRPPMERLIGAIQTLALYPPYPVLMPLLPQTWGKQLLGDTRHTKQQIAMAVNARLGTAFQGDIYDNHAADSVGIALVALDTLRMAAYVRQHSKDDHRRRPPGEEPTHEKSRPIHERTVPCHVLLT